MHHWPHVRRLLGGGFRFAYPSDPTLSPVEPSALKTQTAAASGTAVASDVIARARRAAIDETWLNHQPTTVEKNYSTEYVIISTTTHIPRAMLALLTAALCCGAGRGGVATFDNASSATLMELATSGWVLKVSRIRAVKSSMTRRWRGGVRALGLHCQSLGGSHGGLAGVLTGPACPPGWCVRIVPARTQGAVSASVLSSDRSRSGVSWVSDWLTLRVDGPCPQHHSLWH